MGFLDFFKGAFATGANYPSKDNWNVQYEQQIADRDWQRNQQAAQQAFLNEMTSAQMAMNWDAQQAALNRQFQQSSAQQAMQFSASEAALNRQWQEAFQSTLPAGGATAKVHVFYARIYPYTINSARRFS